LKNIFKDILSHTYQLYKEYLSEILVISYPKSGRTWMRLLIGKALALHFNIELGESHQDWLLRPGKFKKLNSNIPLIYFSHDDKPHTKTTESINSDKAKYYYKKIIFLFRDPRDVIVSQFFSLTRRTKGNRYPGTLYEFMDDNKYGMRNHIRYLNVWAQARKNFKNILFISYEEMSENTSQTLKKVFDFFGIDADLKTVINEAVEFAKFENMQQMEKSQVFKSKMLRPVDINDTNSYKVREGRVNGYLNHLNNQEVKHLNSLINTTLNKFYPYSQ